MDEEDIDQKVLQYEHFINDVLKEDLRRIDLHLQRINAEISDLIQQKNTLKVIKDKSIHPKGFKSQVNIGCNFFMEAAVSDTSKLLLNIGLNHYVEFTVEEANKYLDVRIKAFERKEQELRNKSAETKAHVKLMLIGISEIENEKYGTMS